MAQAGALSAGFLGLLLLMAFMAIDASRSLQNSEVATSVLTTESRKRDALLDQLRADIFRSATIARDYLLETDNTHAESQKNELRAIHSRIDETLSQYEARLPENEKDAFRDMQARFESYWKSIEPVLQWDSSKRQSEGQRFLQEIIVPVRTQVVQLTRQVTTLNENDLDAGEARIREVQARFRRRVTTVFVLALLLGTALAWGSIRRVRRLEKEASSRFEEVAEARQELIRLSDRLVTVQEEERRNLSRELHDEVGQAMSAMLVELGRLETAPDNGARREQFALVRRMAESTVEMVRNMALLLRPSMLDDLGLIAALRWLAREVSRRSGLKVKMIADEIEENLSDAHRTCIYRVVQEALNNCARHSRATQARVVVHRDADGLSVTVQDDGIGFQPEKDKGMGLLGMEERVDRLGGRFTVESKPGSGTVLRVFLPLANSEPSMVKSIV